MNRFVSVLLLALLASSLVLVAARQGYEEDLNKLGYELKHVRTYYRDGHTVFVYDLTVGAYAQPLSQFAIGTARCHYSFPELEDESLFEPFGTISTLGDFRGYRYPYQQEAGTTVTYELVFEGKVGSGKTQWAARGGDKFGSGDITGPDCGADNDYAEPPVSDPITVGCGERIPESKDPKAEEHIIPGDCKNEYTIKRIYTINKKGLVTEAYEYIHVEDKVAPVFDHPEKVKDLTLECDEYIPKPLNLTATDYCGKGRREEYSSAAGNELQAERRYEGSNAEVSYCEEITNGTCPQNYYIVRTWTATDECGNSKCLTQTITVVDNTKPTLDGVPRDQVIECNLTAGTNKYPEVPKVTASDNCGQLLPIGENKYNPYVKFDQVYIKGACANTYTLKRTWSAMDACGNEVSESQYIHVKDTTKPVLKIIGDDYVRVYDCNETIPVPTVVAYDNCMEGPIEPTLNVTRIDGECPGTYTIRRVWTACDACGNVAYISRTYQVVDKYAPTFSYIPKNDTVECDKIPSVPAITVTDNCDRYPDLKFYNTTKPGDCPNEYQIIRRWVAEDNCHNKAEIKQVITVVDLTAPVIDESSLPKNLTFQCAFEVPPQLKNISIIPIQNASCDNSFNVSTYEKPDNGSCPHDFTLIRKWTVSDCSGNKDYAYRQVVVHDDTKPVLHGVPDDEVQYCFNILPAPTVTASDNCDCPYSKDCLKVYYSNVTNDKKCAGNYTVFRKWSATDSCGNEVYQIQRVFVRDTRPPKFHQLPEDERLPCSSTITKPKLEADDDCGPAKVNNDIPDEIIPGKCSNEWTVIQKWSATDDCDNTVYHSRKIYVFDAHPPRIEGVPKDILYAACDEVPKPPSVSAYDACGNNITLSYKQEREEGDCTGRYKLIRTWTARDACGNESDRKQTIHVDDRKAPKWITKPQADLYFSCENVTLPDPPKAEDTCSKAKVYEDSYKLNGDCPQSYTLYRRFYAVDDCKNKIAYTYRVFVEDKKAPIITVPEKMEVDSCTPPAKPNSVNLTDNCDYVPSLTQITDGTPRYSCKNNYTFTRTFFARDDCYNVARKEQKITVFNTKPPKFFELPNTTVEYDCKAPAAQKLQAADACGNVFYVNPQASNSSRKCKYEYTEVRTWTAVDDCGLKTKFVQTVKVVDRYAPKLYGVPEKNLTDVPCNKIPEAPYVSAKDNCDNDVDVDFIQTISDKTCTGKYRITRKWTAVDDCQLKTVHIQTIDVVDKEAPVFNEKNPGNYKVDCVHPEVKPPTATDNCDKKPVITAHHYKSNIRCNNSYDYNVAFKAVDDCGNVNWFNYTIYVQDDDKPTVTWSPRNPYEDFKEFTCKVPAAPTPSAKDKCDATPSIYGPQENITSLGCEYRKEVVRRWKIEDDCKNSVEFYDKIRLVHTVPPKFNNRPANEKYECDKYPYAVVPNVTATDNCGKLIEPVLKTNQTNGNCYDNFAIYRTWNASDECGLFSIHTQIVQVSDTTAPYFVNEPCDRTEENQCYTLPADPIEAKDNCDPKPDIVLTNKTRDVICSYAYRKEFTWTVTDRCGNENKHVQWVNYTWTKRPTLYSKDSYGQLPSDLHDVLCHAVPAPAKLYARDGCGKELEVYYKNETIPSKKCKNEYIIVHKWWTVDDCGLEDKHVQKVYVIDNVPPVISGVPGDTTAECGFVPKKPDVCATDNCDGVELHFIEEVIPGKHCCDYKLVRTWTATDECGNTVNATQRIKVHDTIPPVLINVPCDKTVECPYKDVVENVTAHEPPKASGYCVNSYPYDDECSSYPDRHWALSLSHEDKTLYLKFKERAYVLQGLDGSARIGGELVSIDDESREYELYIELSGASRYEEIQGYGDKPVLLLKDNCFEGGSGYPPRIPGFIPISPSTWQFYTQGNGTLKDIKGEQIIHFFGLGGQPAQFGLGASGHSVRLGGLVTLQHANYGNAKDNAHLYLDKILSDKCDLSYLNEKKLECGGEIPVNLTVVTKKGDCEGEYTIIKTWTACDKSYNCVNASQVIHVEDTTAPVIKNVPKQKYLNCTDPIPTDQPNAYDDCDPYPTLTEVKPPVREDGKCPQTYTLTRKWVAADACGNKNYAYQKLYFSDTEAPVIHGVYSGDSTVECDEVPAPPKNVYATDNCDKNVTVDYDEYIKNGSCLHSYIIERSWYAVDDCGNYARIENEITVRDTKPPTFYNLPEKSVTVECTDDFPPADPKANDTCSQVEIKGPFIKRETPGPCNGVRVVERYWTATDNCKNTAYFYQTVNFVDTTPPQFVLPLPTNDTVQCDEVPNVPNVDAFDNCGDKVDVEFFERKFNQTCKNSYVIERKWVATDCSGLVSTHTIYITVIDTKLPTLANVPVNQKASCRNVPKPPSVTASDNCDGVFLFYTEDKLEGSCPYRYRLVRNWRAVDACNNQYNETSSVVVFDETEPKFNGDAPKDVKLACDKKFTPEPQTATDDCSYSVKVTMNVSLIFQNKTCPQNKIYEYVWTATDECGNKAYRKQKVEYYDNVAPEIKGVPANAEAQCYAPPASTSVTASDNCDKSVTPVLNETTQDKTCKYNFTVVRRWTAIDDCGNKAEKTQYITVRDKQPPKFVYPPKEEVEYECKYGKEPQVDNLEAVDNCDPYTYFTVKPTTEKKYLSCPNNYNLNVEWKAVDACYLSTTVKQVIKVRDTKPPRLDNVPENTRVPCDKVPTPPTVTAYDDCEGNINVNYSFVRYDGSCPYNYTLVRTWTATDKCGNTVSKNQTIEVYDNIQPVILTKFNNQNLKCNDSYELPNPKNIQVKDVCSDKVTVTVRPKTIPGNCPQNFIITVTITATDECKNSVSTSYNLSFVDDVPPVFINPPQDRSVACDDLYSIADTSFPEVKDNCANNVKPNSNNSVYKETDNYEGGCKNYTITRYWEIRDPCGNKVSHTQTIKVYDNKAPEFDNKDKLPKDKTVSCDAVPPQEDLTASDNCGPAKVNKTEKYEDDNDNCPNSYNLIRKWVATDACGHTTTHVQKIRVEDKESPKLHGVPNNTEVECKNIPAKPEVTATDNCFEYPRVDFDYKVIEEGCVGNYTIVRTWSTSDQCNPLVEKKQYIKVRDNRPPYFNEKLPKDQVLECTEPIVVPKLTASDDCSEASVNYTYRKIEGDCDANYTIVRKWVATDKCKLTTEHTQYVTVQDSKPPVFTPEKPVCLLPLEFLSVFEIDSVTDLEYGLFDVEDACSAINITVTGCSSNQDEDLYVYAKESGFTRDCKYDVYKDKLVIYGRLDWLVPEGRIFTITGYATDACGHQTDVRRDIWIPLNRTSIDYVSFDIDFDRDCKPSNHGSCEGFCPCEYSLEECALDEDGHKLEFIDSYYNKKDDVTTFRYLATFNAYEELPERLTLGLDLTHAELVSYTPDVLTHLGYEDDSYISGITFFISDKVVDEKHQLPLSITLRGNLKEKEDSLSYQFLGGEDAFGHSECGHVVQVTGPKTCERGSEEEEEYKKKSIGGHAYLVGVSQGTDRKARIPLAGVVIQLLHKGEAAAVVLTDEDGAYRFSGVEQGYFSNFKVVVLDDGILRPDSGFNKLGTKFLKAVTRRGGDNEYDVYEDKDNEGAYGKPRDLEYSAQNDFFFVLDSKVKPGYANPLASHGFKSNGKSVAYWLHQFSAFKRGCGHLKHSHDEFERLFSVLDRKLAKCYGDKLSGNSELAAAILNEAAGKGVFEPYDQIQHLIIEWARYILCEGSGSDAKVASGLVKRLLPPNAH